MAERNVSRFHNAKPGIEIPGLFLAFDYLKLVFSEAVEAVRASMWKRDGPVFHNEHLPSVLHTADFSEHAVILIVCSQSYDCSRKL